MTAGRLAAALCAAGAIAIAAACAPPAQAPPASAWELHYLTMRRREREPARVGTRIYRAIASRSLFSECRMMPHDSEAFDARLRRCDAVTAVVVSFARLLLERAATPAFLRPVVIDGKVRWVDPPTSCAH